MKKILAPEPSFALSKLCIQLSLIFPVILPLTLYAQEAPLFELLSPAKSGVNFKNQLKEDEKHNILTYEYFYNGGGAAIGDINNDGWEDIFFTSNMGKNVLYLNASSADGQIKFKDISKSAKVEGKSDAWSTGVTMVDINQDGLLDIYVCYSGWQAEDLRRNELYINQGNATFVEKAAEYGLDDPSNSTQAAFFDFDKDGDLDMYLLNHNTTVIYEVEYNDVRDTRHPQAGDKLYENVEGHFVDISEKAGIKGSPLGFGLGIAIADVNGDGWQDIFVSNDYIEPDYLYINNTNGPDGHPTFTDRTTEYFQHISYFSMGSDIVDINNDAQPDIFTLDMLPEDNERQKLLYGPDNYEHYALMVMNGFYHQNMRNMLHLNNGSASEGQASFSEIGQLAGISNTDWSWSSFFADFDNDGWKDLFITNGYYRDYTNRDFLKYKGDYFFQKAVNNEKADTFQLVSSMTSTPVHNYIFKNEGRLNFTDKSKAWGFDAKTFSNGAAYGDLDNDGDLDLVVNNLNERAFIHKNLSREQNPEHNYLALKLQGKNLSALGARLKVYTSSGVQFFENMPTRGFQSSMSQRIHIGLGKAAKVDSIEVQWLSGNRQLIREIAPNQLLTIVEDESQKLLISTHAPTCVFQKVTSPVPYQHQEYAYNDFKRQPLLMNMLTTCGPAMTMADVNQDELPDIFVGGAKGSMGKVYIQTPDGQYVESKQNFVVQDQLNTDADALFFDADGDGDPDLYVASGGYQDFGPQDLALQDLLYLNDGQGNFERLENALPSMLVSKSCVVPVDFDNDGDMDVFVGGRVIPGQYPMSPQSFLLENEGNSSEGTPTFSNVIADKIPGLAQSGMITDAAWTDLNGDGWKDLIVVGEYMPIKVYLNQGERGFADATAAYFERPLAGLWNKLLLADFDNDGDQDIVAANFGLNSQLKVSQEEPLRMLYKDFDGNGSVDPILTYYIQGKPYPFASRGELLDQIYSMRQKYTSYADYANAQIEDIFSKEDLKDASVLTAETLETMYLENKDGQFVSHPLPQEAQFAPIYAMTTLDYNQDGHMDLILAGNQSAIRIRMGVMDANYGQLFEGDSKGNFTYIPQAKSGLNLKGDVKSLESIKIKDSTYLLVGINNAGLESYKLMQP
ncbi:VCBS repeat-containing protein [Catalinimonas niigatensis]|uniref:VCBS repeat-containing protein n=1 Tax=Catalinimonas niigatensis TaxID=1397264 RepID=UPI002665AFF4|nr:VCBS repeat-containing protein [Catalinimonas niigatensis]WPP53267.1 VCBS repeat-containing protein [Catalinimonas niigatensis]